MLSEEEKAADQSEAHSPAQITLFWATLKKGQPLCHENLSECVRLCRIALAMVGTSVADERTFSTRKYVSEHVPSLTMLLQPTVRAAGQTVFSLSSSALDEARKVWAAMPKRGGDSTHASWCFCAYQDMCAKGAKFAGTS